MADIMNPTVDITEFPGLLRLIVADAIAKGMSEDDIRVWLGTLAHEEYWKQLTERKA
jgi:hypothetical protein